MKLSFSTLGCPDWSYIKILENAKKMGYDAISVRCIERKTDLALIPEFMPENRKMTLSRAAEYGIKLLCLCTGCFFHSEDIAEKGIKEGIAAVETASEMGIPFIRVFGDTVPEDKNEKKILNMIADGIGKVCKSAEGTDVKVLLETHGNINTSERILYIADKINIKNFSIIWDIAHSDRAYKDDIQPFYEAVKHLICHTHIKDHIRGGKPELCRVGDGDIPITKILNMLEKDGYKGYYEFEWEKMWHPELAEPEISFKQYVEYMKKCNKNSNIQ